MLISQILSSTKDSYELKQLIDKRDINWEHLVRVASEHLVLPTLLSIIQHKSLLDNIPNDLKDYLIEIHAINKNRNLTLLSEITYISNLFKEHKINHVFIKGAALLVNTYSSDVGMRMVGDIDILVAKADIKKAYSLLLKNNYYEVNQAKGYQYYVHRHLPRLIPKTGLASVELHHSLLSGRKEKLIPIGELLLQKKQVENIWIPQTKHLVEHAIYDHQLNDLGFYYNRIHMKNMFDTYSLLRNNSTLLQHYKKLDKYTRHYFGLMTIYYPEIAGDLGTNKVKVFRHGLSNYQTRELIFGAKSHLYKVNILTDRFKLFLSNKNYRKFVFEHVINKK